MLAWFEQLSLRTKLVLGFGSLIGLMLIGGGVALFGGSRTLAAMEGFVDGANRIAELSLESSAAMGQARRYEKEFLLKTQAFSHAEARLRYATLVVGQLTAVRENMAAIRGLAADPETLARTRAVEAASRRYETGFLTVVELYGRQGRMDSGLEGQFRQQAHLIEAVIDKAPVERLRTDLLSLRRYEKDFIIRGLTRDAEAYERAYRQFASDLGRAALPAAGRDAVRQALERYGEAFREYVATDGEIEATSLDYLEAVHRIEPDLEALHRHAGEAAAATREALSRLGRTTSRAALAAGIAAILLGLLVAVFIIRNAERSIAASVEFASRLAAGEWEARLPPALRGREFAVLAAALNRMAQSLGDAHRNDAARAAELLRLNRTLRMLSRCNEALVRAAGESELLEAVCREIVDSGGYRLAWVGFACHDPGCSVEPVAYAGIGGDYIDELRLTWGDDSRRRGVGGAAIREGRPFIARQIASDPVYAPWREQALRRGFASCMALPLRGRDGVLGTLGIYSADADAFDDEEARLLGELADDLAFGIVSLREAAGRASAEQALAYQANYDAVTGLANRNLFADRLRQATLHAARNGRQAAVVRLELDRFREINDSLGHEAAAALLKHVGAALASSLRAGDTVARLDGEEFAVAIGDLEAAEEVAPVALKLLAAVVEPMAVAGNNVYTSASLGISLFPKDGDEAGLLLQHAEIAMSNARALGGNQFRFYAAEMNERVSARFAMESALRRALERGELQIHFQPRVKLASGELSGAEALLRWQHPEKGTVSPAEFIALAEDSGLILPIGEWVIRSVCRQLRAWLDSGLAVPPVAVNLSPRQFRQAGLAALIRQELAANGLESRYFEVEITESSLMDNLEQAVAVLDDLRASGIKLALDDFGTGHSSLARLRHLPIDHLKIDQAFVRKLTSEPADAAVCLAIIGLAHHLRQTVIAEGVESEGQATYLRQHRCDEIQGFYFSPPLPAAEFGQLLAQRKTLALPAPPIGERRRLLLVDDERNVLSSLKRLLRGEGYDLLSVGSAREGLELLATEAVQVIVSDQRMQEMSGTEFLSRVRDLYPETVRLVLSGYADLDTVTEAVNRGSIYKFISKPWDAEMLLADIREAFLHYEAQPARAQAAA